MLPGPIWGLLDLLIPYRDPNPPPHPPKKLTLSSHWCAVTATCVPSGLVSTSTSPGTALSGLGGTRSVRDPQTETPPQKKPKEKPK